MKPKLMEIKMKNIVNITVSCSPVDAYEYTSNSIIVALDPHIVVSQASAG